MTSGHAQDVMGLGLEAAVRQMPDMVVMVEAPSGRVLLTNQRAHDMMERLGSRVGPNLGSETAVFYPDGRKYPMSEWPILRSVRGEHVVDEEYFHVAADGTRIMMRCNSSPVYGDDGRIVAAVAVARDITAQKQADARLRHHARLLDNVLDAVIATDQHYVLTAWNKGAEAMFGWAEDEVLGRGIREVIVKESTEEQWSQAFLELGQTGRRHAEAQVRRKDGTLLWVEALTIALHDERGAINGYASITRDVSERKRHEIEQRRLADIVQHSSDFIGICDLDLRAVFVNEAGQKMIGLDDIDEVTRKVVLDFFCPEDRAFVRDTLLPSVLQSGRWSGEMDLQHFRTGQRIPVLWDAFRIDDPHTGRPINIAAITRDITERKRIEEALRESGRRIESILESITDAFFVVDRDWRYTYVNRSAAALVRRTREDLMGKVAWEEFAAAADPSLRFRAELGRAMEERFPVHFEEYHPSMEKWVGVWAYPFEGGLAVWARDITEGKDAQDKLGHHARLLEQLHDAVFATDERYVVTAWNRAAEDMFGWTTDEAVGRVVLELIPTIDSEGQLAQGVDQLTRHGRRTSESPRWRHKDGRTVTAEARAVALKGDDGRTTGYLCVMRDISDRLRASGELERRARQQAVVAELGLRALADTDLQSLMDEAVSFVARTLEADYAKLSELLPGGDELLIRALSGWRRGPAHGDNEPAGARSQAGFTLGLGQPVVSEDLEAETRFEVSSAAAQQGARCAATVLVRSLDGHFGVLETGSRQRRPFSTDDVNFLQAVANVLGTAVERREAERHLREVRERERSRIARDLHDEALRDLAYAVAETHRARSSLDDKAVATHLEGVIPALNRVGQQVRAVIYDLRLGAEIERPFPELIESLVELHRSMATQCDIELDAREGVPSDPLGRTGSEVLRIVGEALTNARRHSGATTIRVALWGSNDTLWVEVLDNGRGFDAGETAVAARGFGIKGMHERAAMLGADLEIRSDRAGTTLLLGAPLRGGTEHPVDRVRILLVEDHAAVREALSAVLAGEEGFEVVGEAASLGEARQMLDEVDVAVVDLVLPDGYGGDLIRDLREVNPQAQALVLSASVDRADIAYAVESGAAGVLSKTSHLDEVVDSVRRLMAGEALLPVSEVVELLRFASRRRQQEQEEMQLVARLTPRECEVLQALADGLDSKGIAQRLHITVRTERNHMASILIKLGLHSRLQALLFALRYGIVDLR